MCRHLVHVVLLVFFFFISLTCKFAEFGNLQTVVFFISEKNKLAP